MKYCIDISDHYAEWIVRSSICNVDAGTLQWCEQPLLLCADLWIIFTHFSAWGLSQFPKFSTMNADN